MTYALFFWILVLFAIVFDVWARLPVGAPPPQGRPRSSARSWIASLLLFALIILLGLGIYGPALHR